MHHLCSGWPARFLSLLALTAAACTGLVEGPRLEVEAPPDGGTQTSAQPPAPAGCTALLGPVTALSAGVYCVTGDVIIPTGITLDIPAGTTFIFKGRFHFGRDPALPDLDPPAVSGSGTLRAIGTADQPIIFRGETADTRWYGLTISHAHAPVQLEYVTISDTYKDETPPGMRILRRGGALNSYMNEQGTILRHCTFTNNRALTVAGAVDIIGHGQWPHQGLVEITDSLFENNSCECAQYDPSSANLCGGGALRLTLISGDGELVKLQGNVFKGNAAHVTAGIEAYGGAVSGAHSEFVLGPGNVFELNTADTGDGAISCNHEPRFGSVIDGVDVTTTFTRNTPDNGCGR